MWNEILADSTIIEKFNSIDYVLIDFVMEVLMYIFIAQSRKNYFIISYKS